MPQLELFLLGSPLVLVDGQPVSLRSRKALALVAYLALEGGRHSREKLTALLWPDAEPEAGRNSLRNTLSGLREVLADVIQADRQSVGLEARVDALELELRFEDATVQQLEAVSKLYRDEFLEGVSLGDADEFDAWVLERRRFYRRQLETLLEHLTDRHEREGRLTEALELAERWLALDRLNELAVQRVVGLHGGQGNRGAALEAFEAFRTALRDELGLEPAPETIALAERLRLEAPAPKPRNPRLPSLPTLLLEGRMVGRVTEFVKLVEAYHTSAQGQPRLVCLAGEPGIGKTRLVTEFLTWAGSQGANVLRGRAFETGAGLAYQPMADAVRRIFRSEPQPKSLLSPVWLSELARLLPELLERLPDLPVPVGDEAVARTRLFEAITRLGLNLAARAPVVVFVDDVQWADAATLELIAYTARRWLEEETPILLLFTVRSEALAGVSPLQAWLTALGRDLNTTMLSLEALTANDTLRLVEEIGGANPDFAAWLHRETDGQPLYIVETLKSLAERGLIAPDASGWHMTAATLEEHSNAPGVRAVIEARFSRLSTDARTLLEASATLGQGFGFEPLRTVADLNEREALAALDELLRSRLLLETGGQYAFSHDRVRETAQAGIAEARRRVYHRRAYQALEGTGAAPAVLALHAHAAHLWLEAFQASIRAGQQAANVYAWRESLALFETARNIVRDRPDGVDIGPHVDARTLGEVYSNLSARYQTLNDFDAIKRLPDEVLEVARRLEQPWLEAHALLFKADALNGIQLDQAAPYLEQARTIFERLGDREGLFEIEVCYSIGTRSTGPDMRETIARVKALLPLAQRLGSTQEEWVLGRLADAHQGLGDWQEAAGCWQQLVNIHTTAKSDWSAYRFENLGFCQLNFGDLQAALPNLLTAYQIKLEIDDNPTWIGMAGCYRSYGLIESGALHEALELAEAAYALCDKALTRHATEFGMALGMARIAVGRCADARAPLEHALGLTAHLGPPDRNLWGDAFKDFLESHLCASSALEGDWPQALEHARNATHWRFQTNNERGLHTPRLRHWLEVKALLHGGEDALARTLVQRLGAVVRSGERLEVSYLRALAMLEAWDGKHDLARGHLQQALGLAQTLGLVLEQRELQHSLEQLPKTSVRA